MRSLRYRALAYCLSAQTPWRLLAEGKQVTTFPDHALSFKNPRRCLSFPNRRSGSVRAPSGLDIPEAEVWRWPRPPGGALRPRRARVGPPATAACVLGRPALPVTDCPSSTCSRQRPTLTLTKDRGCF